MENRLEYKSDSHKIRMTGFTHIGICKKVKNSIKNCQSDIRKNNTQRWIVACQGNGRYPAFTFHRSKIDTMS